jgi:hypothetical protein
MTFSGQCDMRYQMCVSLKCQSIIPYNRNAFDNVVIVSTPGNAFTGNTSIAGVCNFATWTGLNGLGQLLSYNEKSYIWQ